MRRTPAKTTRPSPELRTRLEAASLAGSHTYVAELRALMRALHKAVLADLRPFIALYAGRRQDGGISDLATRVGHFIAQVPGKVARFFRKMAATLVQANRAVMSEILGRPPAAPSPGVLEAAERESVRLVKLAAERYGDQIRSTLAAGGTMTPEDLEAALAKRGEVSESQAALIARDQTVKLNAQLTRDAQQAAGYERYWWLTCRDDRVRPTHEANESIIFAWSNPSPITGHPGHDPLCRCNPIPYDGPLAPGERV